MVIGFLRCGYFRSSKIFNRKVNTEFTVTCIGVFSAYPDHCPDNKRNLKISPEYGCEQDEFQWTMNKLMDWLKKQ